LKLVIVGNCQITYIGETLRQQLGESSEIYIPEAVHLIDENKVTELHKKISECDFLVVQPIGENYRDSLGLGTNYLKNLLNKDAQAIIFPNLYFGGLFPTFGYLPDKDNNLILARDEIWQGKNLPFSDYHDYLMVVCAINDYSPTQFSSLVRSNLPLEVKNELFEFSFNELKKRDEICHVKATDVLDREEFSPDNFHSFNHPSNSVMNRIASSILKMTGVENTGSTNETAEALIYPKLPVYPFLFENLQGFSPSLIESTFSFYLNYYNTEEFRKRIKGSVFPKEFEIANKLIEAVNAQ
jgi:hypothetical protein